MPDVPCEIDFDPLDTLSPAEADELVAELGAENVDATVVTAESKGSLAVATIVALVTLATTTAAGLAVTVAFLHRTFECGVVVDASGTPVRVGKDKNLPSGSVLIISKDGEPHLHRSMSGSDLVALMHGTLAGKQHDGTGS